MEYHIAARKGKDKREFKIQSDVSLCLDWLRSEVHAEFPESTVLISVPKEHINYEMAKE